MSITTEIQRINGSKNAIRTLASQKNVNIPSTALIDSYASVLGAQWPDCTKEVRYDGDKIRGITRRCTNIFDEETESGGIYSETGEVGPDSMRIRSKNFIPVSGGNNYFFASSNSLRVAFYDKDKVYFGESTGWKAVQNNYLSIPINVGYIKIVITNTTVYNHDVAIIQGTTGTYEPYTPNLIYAYYKGIKLGQYDYIDTSSNLLHIGGEVVDLGAIDYNYDARGFFYSRDNFADAAVISAGTMPNIVCSKYGKVVSVNSLIAISIDCISYYTYQGINYLHIRDIAFDDRVAFKQAMSGVKLYYELATPIEIPL